MPERMIHQHDSDHRLSDRGCTNPNARIMSALRLQGKSVTDLCQQRIVVAGAGSAGIGVATALYEAMVAQGVSAEEAGEDEDLVLTRTRLLQLVYLTLTILGHRTSPFISHQSIIHYTARDLGASFEMRGESQKKGFK